MKVIYMPAELASLCGLCIEGEEDLDAVGAKILKSAEVFRGAHTALTAEIVWRNEDATEDIPLPRIYICVPGRRPKVVPAANVLRMAATRRGIDWAALLQRRWNARDWDALGFLESDDPTPWPPIAEEPFLCYRFNMLGDRTIEEVVEQEKLTTQKSINAWLFKRTAALKFAAVGSLTRVFHERLACEMEAAK